MAVNDITILDPAQFGTMGTIKYAVAASATIIQPGEPVAKALGGFVVSQALTNTPVVATDYWAGIAMSVSSNTAAVAGTVEVLPLSENRVYLIAPNVAATWDTQAEYDALVGDRVLIDLTAGVFTILAADGATSGLVIMPLDVSKYPNKVAFSIRAGVSYLA